MISFYLNATNPGLFAASIFVGSQWDINILTPLAHETFFYFVSAGDKINIIKFTKGTVVPAGASERGAPEHMYSFDYAYQLKEVRNCLFQQKKN